MSERSEKKSPRRGRGTKIGERFTRAARGLQGACRTPTRRGNTSSNGDAEPRPVSWESAQAEASKWLGTLKLGRDLYGQVVDLGTKGDTLEFTGKFREMVIEAARRKLVKRKAKEIIMPL